MDETQQAKQEAEDRHDEQLATYLRNIGAHSLAFCLLAIMFAEIVGLPFALHQIPNIITSAFQ